MIWSDQRSMGATGKTDASGNYHISGLNAATDYVVSVQDNTTTFYYHPNGAVVQASKKGWVVLSAGEDVTSIDMTMIAGDTMKGTVRNSEKTPIANVWVSAWSSSLGSGGSCFTNGQGQFMIKNLLSGQDYSVEVTPDNTLGYISQTQSNIQSTALKVDFVLKKGFILSGCIRRADQTPVETSVIKISSISQNIFQSDTADAQGNYEIQGLPASNDYILHVTPPGTAHLTRFEERNFMIDDHTSLQITLSSALSLSGTVQIPTNDLPKAYTLAARINVYSESGFDQWTSSDSQGNFILYHVPDGSNYQISVYADNFADQTLYQVAAGDSVNILLSEGKNVQGDVKNSRGQAVSNARVEIYSEMINLTKSTITNNHGTFALEGLPEFYNASAVDDYILRVTAPNYPETQKNNIQPGDTVSIVLDADESLFISGTVSDHEGNPIPSGTSVVIRLYEKVIKNNTVKMLSKQTIDGEGNFLFTGLDANKRYTLQFKHMDNTSERKKEWLGDNDRGVGNKEDAIFYSPGQAVMFRFSDIWH